MKADHFDASLATARSSVAARQCKGCHLRVIHNLEALRRIISAWSVSIRLPLLWLGQKDLIIQSYGGPLRA